MRIAGRKILVPIAFFGLGLLTAGAAAEDAAHDRSPQPEQIARSVEGSPPTHPANPASYAIQNDLLVGSSLQADTPESARPGWMTPLHPSDLADPARDELDGFDGAIEAEVDPNEPKSIELSEGVHGKLRAKSSGALLGISVGFW